MRANEFINEISRDKLERYLERAGRQVDARQERMARVRDRLNRGYEIYHAETPNKIVHRFEANTPAEAKRYYDDFITKYESDVDYDLRLRRATGIMEDSENYGGIQLSLEIQKDDAYVDDDDTDNQVVFVKATSNGRELGHVLFTMSYDGQGLILNPQDLEVDERYRGQGIAQTMYDFVKSKGYRIRRSGQQTDAGEAFWQKHRPGQNVWEDSLEKSPTFAMPRRSLNVPELIKRGAIFITHPHGANGWELNQPTWDFSLITLENVLKKSPPWSAEAPKYIRPESYQEAIKSKLWDGLGDEKYKQILWSIKKLGIPEQVAFLDTVSENFADGKKPGRKGLSKRVGIPKKATLGQLEKIARSSTGEKRRMAQWQLNMRRGRAKKNK
jgi:GNAT superfamily N-acetyltransferase